jgi:carboxyl-terminal processing protease
MIDKTRSLVKNVKQTKIVQKLQYKTLARYGAGALVALMIFGIGVGVGDGRLGLHVGSSVNASLPGSLDYSTVNEVYNTLKKNYDGKLTTSQLIDGLKEGLATATGDPYTEYFNPDQAKQFNDELNNSFSGIGAELGKDSDGNLIVVSPIAGFPAAKAGLRAQDIIASINGESTTNMDIDTAVNKIRGKKGTSVTLQIIRDKSKTLTVKITRDTIVVPSVQTKILPGNIGYVQISTFADDTSNLIEQAANTLTNAHVKGIVLDLRDNPGGLVDAAVHVSSLWLPGGKTIMQEKRGNTVVQTYTSLGDDVLKGIPTVVLVNGGSASASEITAGALHDNGVATIMGVKSYGKGSVQEIQDFSDGGELKVTVARWYRPNGQNIDKKGITPDKVIQLTDQDIAAGKDPQKDAAIQYLQNQ